MKLNQVAENKSTPEWAIFCAIVAIFEYNNNLKDKP